MLDDAAEPYFVPILCSSSDYVVKALKQDAFSERSTRTLRPPGCDEETFACSLHWLTFRRLPSNRSHGGEHGIPRNCEHCHSAMIKLWTFGDAYLLPKMQNLAMFRLIELCHDIHMSAADAKLAYGSTAKDSWLTILGWGVGRILRRSTLLAPSRGSSNTLLNRIFGQLLMVACAIAALNLISVMRHTPSRRMSRRENTKAWSDRYAVRWRACQTVEGTWACLVLEQ